LLFSLLFQIGPHTFAWPQTVILLPPFPE
jgi:hypothetical protein